MLLSSQLTFWRELTHHVFFLQTFEEKEHGGDIDDDDDDNDDVEQKG